MPDVINGDTSAAASNANNRQKRIKSFQEKPGFGVIILSPLAVGFGVNIQAANHVVHFTRTWNPAKEDQATDRAYRIGQMKDVFVYYPVVVADDFVTFDAKLDLLLEWKRGLSTDMLNGSGDLRPSDFGDLGSPGGGSAFGNEPLIAADIECLAPDAFEAFCALLWSKLGYKKTFRTPQTGDGGVDVVAISGKNGVLIQCKSSSVDGKELGWEAVKDVVAGSAAYAAKYPGVKFSLAAVTNRRFNGNARAQAHLNHVDLLDGQDLAKRLDERPVTKGELAAFLMSGW
jgi:Holliday junction resolvase